MNRTTAEGRNIVQHIHLRFLRILSVPLLLSLLLILPLQPRAQEYTHAECSLEDTIGTIAHPLPALPSSPDDSTRHQLLSPKASYRLAVLLARMKSYAASLKFFALSRQLKRINTGNSYSEPLNDSALLKLASACSDYPRDTVLLANRIGNRKNLKLKPREITAPFRDGTAGSGYAILLHINQPEAGNRRQYALFNNVGHMFVTLVKFESDSAPISRTFGFYPEKSSLLDATPLKPGTASVFKDDYEHQWDEMVGKFISRRQFRVILRRVKQYARKRYHLNHNNCTDFGLNVATIAGIQINETKGSWPLGGGNDPGDTGQSILEGKVMDMLHTDDDNTLFICTASDNL